MEKNRIEVIDISIPQRELMEETHEKNDEPAPPKPLLNGKVNPIKVFFGRKKDAFIVLRAQGYTYDKISKMLQMSKPTCLQWAKELKPYIYNLRQLALEALKEEFCVLQRERIKLLGKNLSSLQEELKKRDLKELTAKELFDLSLKHVEKLKEEEGRGEDFQFSEQLYDPYKFLGEVFLAKNKFNPLEDLGFDKDGNKLGTVPKDKYYKETRTGDIVQVLRKKTRTLPKANSIPAPTDTTTDSNPDNSYRDIL